MCTSMITGKHGNHGTYKTLFTNEIPQGHCSSWHESYTQGDCSVNNNWCCLWDVFIIIYPLNTRVVGAPQMISQPVSSTFLCSPLPSGTCRTPSPDVVFPPLPLSALSSSPFHRALQDGFGQTWWTGNMTIPLQFASLYDRQEVIVWSNCLLDLGTDFLIGNMVFVWDV